MLLDSIHTEHGYISRLLRLLRTKLTAIREGHEVNYQLIRDIVTYLQNQAEHYHHPKEDVIYHYYINHYGNEQRILDLEAEHLELAALTAEFAETVDMILMDAVIPLDVFADKLNVFVERQKQHLEMEEKQVFPAIRKRFTSADWAAVESEYQDCLSDPLFGQEVSAQYRELARRLEPEE
ncbi:hemerythrin domain-containing protein [Photobacterium sp. CCB-ST2H9]|uniref:hemerythrin domain-containing protein n=1 Tax=unclassified Photobacterium TaxID=2628852 RepID=UPI0020048CCE|nr:hemerythrin domain-containing protein [Photobacterium sp. CCB-ST2H9]UTM56805.1 hemerythrin domain-containing protein [Photobacterium sp. CCB-ST2H9]